jgi:chromosome segregation ATPase
MSKSMSTEDAKKAADDEKMRLLQKIKDNSNGPEQAKRAIVALDKMVNGLKKRRRLCGESIEEDTKRLFWLQHEIDEVEKQRKKLFDVLEDRRRRRDAAQKARDAIKAQLLEMSKFMDKTRSKVTHRTSKTFSKSTTAELSAARGYNCLPGSTFYPGGNKKKRSTLGKAGRASMSRR